MVAILLKALSDARVVAGIVGALLLSMCALQTARLHHVKSDLAHARALLTDPQSGRSWRVLAEERSSEVKSLNDAASRQQAAVEALRSASDQATRSAAQALSRARDFSATARRQADFILAAKASGDVCKAADELILSSVRGEGFR